MYEYVDSVEEQMQMGYNVGRKSPKIVGGEASVCRRWAPDALVVMPRCFG